MTDGATHRVRHVEELALPSNEIATAGGGNALDAADTPQLAQLVASALASALVDGEGSAYDLARLKDLAQLYGRQLASKPRSERLTPRPRLGEPIGSAPGQRAWVRGVYLVNLTPFSLVISSQGSHLTLEEGTSGSLDAHAEHGLSLKLMHKTARELQQLEQMTLRPALGETSVPLNGPGGILRVLTSRHCAGTYQGECVVLLWSWPYRLRGVRFHDLNYYWNTAMATVGSSLTTPEAIRQVFRPDTLLQQCSLAELHTPGPAQSFVSHAWCLQVNEVFVALARAFAGAEMMRFWIAAFSLNHWCLEEHHGLVSDVLRSRNCQSLAVILGPQAETLKRLWCLYEVLLASDGRPERPGKMALKLCSPQGVLNVGTGGMPVSYILKVSGAINNLNLHQAECNQSDEELRNETFRRRLALHPIASCNAQLRSFMSEGLSSLHQRGQEIFLRASACLQGKGETDLDGRSETAADSDAAGSAVLSDKQCEQHVKEEQADEQLAEEILEKKMEGSFSREMEDGGRRPPVAGALPVLPNQDEHRSRSASRDGQEDDAASAASRLQSGVPDSCLEEHDQAQRSYSSSRDVEDEEDAGIPRKHSEATEGDVRPSRSSSRDGRHFDGSSRHSEARASQSEDGERVRSYSSSREAREDDQDAENSRKYSGATDSYEDVRPSWSHGSSRDVEDARSAGNSRNHSEATDSHAEDDGLQKSYGSSALRLHEEADLNGDFSRGYSGSAESQQDWLPKRLDTPTSSREAECEAPRKHSEAEDSRRSSYSSSRADEEEADEERVRPQVPMAFRDESTPQRIIDEDLDPSEGASATRSMSKVSPSRTTWGNLSVKSPSMSHRRTDGMKPLGSIATRGCGDQA
ncbi:Leucine-rich repeat and WD repeat-containing protein 1 (Origin recognition complex-associated protein) [Durusdinium trenchii]|uniref:Leucine-rich repeat and WD repeat-containing protein 1 (Origin recognition complex-associated protein) n=1 Tax=Durusdinium trenchii TaxID=1381693 RepID=A0ABP0NF48_9DINO